MAVQTRDQFWSTALEKGQHWNHIEACEDAFKDLITAYRTRGHERTELISGLRLVIEDRTRPKTTSECSISRPNV
jgi:hypothetical protein